MGHAPMKLVISLATRGRPEQLLDTVKRSLVNLRHPETEFQIQVDADDQATIEALKDPVPLEALLPLDTQRLVVNINDREDTIADKWNRAVRTYADVYLVAADDDPYVVEGYDSLILEAADRFPDGIGMVYGHLANLSFSGAVAPTRRLVELMGGVIFPPLFPYWFVDHWTDDVARIIGRISFANIITDQSKAGRTQEMREPGWWATFYDAAYLMRRRQAHDIINNHDFICPEWQRHLLLTHHPLIEVRSRMINQSVRSQSKQLSAYAGNLAPDERYNRVKARAIALVPRLLTDYGMPEAEQQMFAKALGVAL
jgi:hypothetical protein